MIQYCSYFKYLSTIIFILAWSACDDIVSPPSDNALPSSERLEVSPEGPLTVGIYEKIVFSLTLVDDTGSPIVDAPVSVAFVDQSYNATLEPNRLTTNSQGKGRVTFTAPPSPPEDGVVSFQVRFQSAEDEVYVSIGVDPTLVGISLEVDYTGKREIWSLEAQLYENSDTTDTASQFLSIQQDLSFPTAITFTGLIADRTYAIEINAKNQEGEIRALGIMEGLRPNTPPYETFIIEDAILGVAGTYEIETHLVPNGALDWSVPELIDNLGFFNDPAAAVLDGIEQQLAGTDPFAAESFAVKREDQAIDEALEAHFSERGIDFKSTKEDVREEMLSMLTDLTLRGTLELAKTDTDFTVLHTLGYISFGPPDAAEALTMPIKEEQQDTGIGHAEWLSGDTLAISSHLINLGLGNPLDFLFRNLLKQTFGTTLADRALLNELDCEGETADFLELLVSDITVRSSIELGCQQAVTTVMEQLGTNTATLNQSTFMTFEGSCDLSIPDTGNQIETLTNGSFDVTWSGESNTPVTMDATFDAVIMQK